jgi:hypothetical protein
VPGVVLSIEFGMFMELDPEARIETESQTRRFPDKTTDANA